MIEKNYQFKSPNYGLRPEGIIIDTIIIHYTDMKDDISALKRLCDKKSGVSAHYLINKLGKIFSLVPEELRAYHAGLSCWQGREKVNDFSIGIELDNNGYEEFTIKQMDSLILLCKEIIKNHPIKPSLILGHSDVAPTRKFDPGRLFNWELLANNGVGFFPKTNEIETIPEIKDVQLMLAKYGYNIAASGLMDKQTSDVMRAFNEHFNPECYNPWSQESQKILSILVNSFS